MKTTYESIPNETASLDGAVPKIEKKPSLYITGALLVMLVFAIGFITGSSGTKEEPLLTLSYGRAHTFSIGSERTLATTFIDNETFKAMYDDILKKEGLTQRQIANLTKIAFEAQQSLIDDVDGALTASLPHVVSAKTKSIVSSSSLGCLSPLVDLDIVVAHLYICVGPNSQGNFVVDVSVGVVGVEIYGVGFELGPCGGYIDGISIPVFPAEISISIEVELDETGCGNTSNWILVNVEVCFDPFGIVCTDFDIPKIYF